jgi:hypothetical protein
MGYKDPEAKKAYQKGYCLQRKYGITIIEYDRILASQNRVCACCYTSNPGGQHKIFNVDHCHKTGKIRGLLCYSCNIGLGHLGDNFQSVSNAITYLSKNEPPIFSGIWKRITPPILPTSLGLSDPLMLKGCSNNKLSKETMGNADTVVAPKT